MSETPLAGAGVAVTRPEEPGGPLERRLQRAGARVLRWSALAIAPPADPAPLARARATLVDYDWIVFTSRRAVTALGPPRAGLRASVAAVGRTTATAAQHAGWSVQKVPGTQVPGTFGLLGELREIAPGVRILLPQSDIASADLANGLASLGAVVDRVEAYRVIPVGVDVAACRAQMAKGAVDYLTFTSPSAVGALERALGPTDFRQALRRQVVSIGPTTTARLLEADRSPDAEAVPSTLSGLVGAVCALARRSG